MTQKQKIFEKFFHNPASVKYSELVLVLKDIGFEKIQAKGSHVKFKKLGLQNDIIIPVHNNECNDFYKKQCYKILKNNSLI